LYDFLQVQFPDTKHDLATAMIGRCLGFAGRGKTCVLVTPNNWLFLKVYARMRRQMLTDNNIVFLGVLGPGAFETISGEVVNVVLACITSESPSTDHSIATLDASKTVTTAAKRSVLCDADMGFSQQRDQTGNPDSTIMLDPIGSHVLLSKYAAAYAGLRSGDTERFTFCFWELSALGDGWVAEQGSFGEHVCFAGCDRALRWEDGKGALAEYQRLLAETRYASGGWKQGWQAWGKAGILISQMGELKSCLSCGTHFEIGSAVIVPKRPDDLPAMWAYCSTPGYFDAVHKVNPSLFVTNASLVNVPFEITHWQKVAAEKYPHGLPKPFSSDPTQWIFDGHPKGADNSLHVAVARLLGYQWPRQTGSSFPDCPALKADGLEKLADADGIVCIPSVRGEDSAADRLRKLLAGAYGKEWKPSSERELIAATGSTADDFDEWLRNDFFEQHCELFHQRPFLWHIWDGRKRDGFHAIVNYHRLAEDGGTSTAKGAKGREGGSHLGRKLLESLTHSYLGEWITRQKHGVDPKHPEDGAEERLAAALELKTQLEAIIEGAPPHDLFVRWKPLSKQAIGWEPDINDGVRMNIRPFLAEDLSGGKKGAGVLRVRPKIKWDKDRGNCQSECANGRLGQRPGAGDSGKF